MRPRSMTEDTPRSANVTALGSCNEAERSAPLHREFASHTQIRTVVLNLAARWLPDEKARLHWCFFESVAAFEHKTACEMLHIGKESVVMDFLFEAISKEAIDTYRKVLERSSKKAKKRATKIAVPTFSC